VIVFFVIGTPAADAAATPNEKSTATASAAERQSASNGTPFESTDIRPGSWRFHAGHRAFLSRL